MYHKPYKSYSEIPTLTREYIQFVADTKTITEIPLEDINSFLTGNAEYAMMMAEHEDGWAI